MKRKRNQRKVKVIWQLEQLRQLRQSLRSNPDTSAPNLSQLILKAQKEVQGQRRERSEPVTQLPQETLDPIKTFYHQAYESMEKLISIRRGWDVFIVREGGERVPQRLPEAPPPSSSAWEKYLTRQLPTSDEYSKS